LKDSSLSGYRDVLSCFRFNTNRVVFGVFFLGRWFASIWSGRTHQNELKNNLAKSL